MTRFRDCCLTQSSSYLIDLSSRRTRHASPAPRCAGPVLVIPTEFESVEDLAKFKRGLALRDAYGWSERRSVQIPDVHELCRTVVPELPDPPSDGPEVRKTRVHRVHKVVTDEKQRACRANMMNTLYLIDNGPYDVAGTHKSLLLPGHPFAIGIAGVTCCLLMQEVAARNHPTIIGRC